jgi:Glu-tRNA(Gln) amidotransferase subunit E-like FAD-binding protein
MRVREELQLTENEFLMIIADNTKNSDDAAEIVVNRLNQLNTFKKEEDETNMEFAARMKITFDAARDDPEGDIEDIDTGIEIPDLPANAPPSATGA